jgi:hypothetical protein
VNTAIETRRRGQTSFRKVALVFVLLLAVGLAAAFVVHDRYVAYAPVTARHVPADATAVVRFDLTHVMFYEPFRRSIGGVLDGIPADPASANRRARLEARGVRVVGDVRELLVAFGPGPGDWVVVLGGRLPAEGLAAELAEVLRAEGRQLVREGQLFTAEEPEMTFTQAEDSAFVLASSPERARAALPRMAPAAGLSDGAGGLFLRSPAVQPPMRSIQAHFRAGSVVALDGEVTFEDAAPAERAQALSELLARLGGGDPVVRAALERSSPTFEDDQARISLRLPREAVEALANRAAAAIMGRRDR